MASSRPRPPGAISRFLEADGFFLSAGLAFFVLVCLVPAVLLGVSMVGFVLSAEQATRAVVDQLTRQFPVYQREIRQVLLRVVQARELYGAVGTVVLVLFATPLFSACRLVLHRILGVRAPREVLRNLLRDAVMVLLLGGLLFAASTLTGLVQWLGALAGAALPRPARWLGGAGVGASLVLSAAMFYLAYRYVPRRRVRAGSALAGAVLASLLWEVAKQLFRLYIQHVGLYDQIYGPLGVLVAFVMFAYYTAVVFVFAAAFVAALEARRR